MLLDIKSPLKIEWALVYISTLHSILFDTLLIVYLMVDCLADSLAANLASCLSSKSIPSRMSA